MSHFYITVLYQICTCVERNTTSYH